MTRYTPKDLKADIARLNAGLKGHGLDHAYEHGAANNLQGVYSFKPSDRGDLLTGFNDCIRTGSSKECLQALKENYYQIINKSLGKSIEPDPYKTEAKKAIAFFISQDFETMSITRSKKTPFSFKALYMRGDLFYCGFYNSTENKLSSVRSFARLTEAQDDHTASTVVIFGHDYDQLTTDYLDALDNVTQ